MNFHENGLPADDYHEISCLICYIMPYLFFFEKLQNFKMSSAANFSFRFIGKGLYLVSRILISFRPFNTK